MITSGEPRLRLRGHGRRLRLRSGGGNDGDPLALLRECCRASLAVEKAMGEAITSARAAGRDWGEIAEVFGAPGKASTRDDVIDARVEQHRFLWDRFWPGGGRA